jgi:hypothetical protein
MVDFLGKIAGPALKDNLLRLGVDLSIETNLLYVDVNNNRIGVNTATPNVDLDVNGLANFKNVLQIDAGNIITLSNNANIYLTPNGTGQVIIANANVSNNLAVGNITAGNATVTSNANVGNLGSTGLITATGNVSGGNLTTTGALSVTGNANVGNLGTAGQINATGNVTGGNLSTSGVLSVTGNANVGNLGTSGLITATGNVTGGNLVTSGVANITGNANVGNLGTSGLIAATGNITGGNLVTGGTLSVTGNANVGNLGTIGLIAATGNVTGGNLVTSGALSVTGNANVGNLGTAGQITASQLISNVATGTSPLIVTSTTQVANLNAQFSSNSVYAVNVTGTNQPNISNIGTLSNLSVTSNISVGNLSATGVSNTGEFNASGNANVNGNLSVNGTVTMGNVNIASILSNGNISANNLSVTNTANLGNLQINDTTISAISANGNVSLHPSGTGVVVANANTALQIPIGASATRPSGTTTGMLRWNTDTSKIEYSDGTTWTPIVSLFTNFTSDVFSGDNTTNTFTLTQESTTAAVMVSINGVLQSPDTAYSVSGTTLTFTEAPALNDTIVARVVTSTATITGLEDGVTNLRVSNSSPSITGNVQGTTRFSVDNTNLTLGNIGIVYNNTVKTVGTGSSIIDSWSTSSYRAAKYIIHASSGTPNAHVFELLATYNGTNTYTSVTGNAGSSSSLLTFSSAIVGSTFNLSASGPVAGISVKVTRQMVV